MLISSAVLIWFFSFLVGMTFFKTAELSSIPLPLSTYFTVKKTEVTYTLVIQNMKVILIIILGAFSLGVTSLINLIGNGLSFGLLVRYSYDFGASTKDILAATLPHGIFELPALWLAGAAGFKGPQVFIRYINGGEFISTEDLIEFSGLSVFSICLMLLAGIIEVKFTAMFL